MKSFFHYTQTPSIPEHASRQRWDPSLRYYGVRWSWCDLVLRPCQVTMIPSLFIPFALFVHVSATHLAKTPHMHYRVKHVTSCGLVPFSLSFFTLWSCHEFPSLVCTRFSPPSLPTLPSLPPSLPDLTQRRELSQHKVPQIHLKYISNNCSILVRQARPRPIRTAGH